MNKGVKKALFFVLILLYATRPFAAPQIVISIKPIHSLISNLTEGVATPTLLMQNASSPHHYAIRPSEMKRLVRADLLLLVGEGLENNLVRIAKTLPAHVTVIELLKTPTLEPIPYRNTHSNESSRYDPHIWLDPLRMIIVAKSLAEYLSGIDPSNQKKYQTNVNTLEKKLKHLHETLVAKLAPLQDKPFLTFHDAYAYLVARYHLKNADFVVQHPEQPLSAEQLSHLSKQVGQGKFACIFQEEDFPSKATAVLTERAKIPIGILNPTGNREPAGPTQYFKMMLQLANSLSQCLT